MESDDENLVINPENLNLSDEGSAVMMMETGFLADCLFWILRQK